MGGPPRNKHVHRRVWFRANARRVGDLITLDIHPGARILTIARKTGDVVVEREDPAERLLAERGDRLLICGPTIEETLGAIVLSSDPEPLSVQLQGELAAATTSVQLLKLAAASSRKRGLKLGKSRRKDAQP